MQKPEMNKKYNTIAAYVLVVAVILISFILVITYWGDVSSAIGKILVVLNPFFWGFAIAYILNPIYCRLGNGFQKLFSHIFKKKKFKKESTLGNAAKITALVTTYIIVIAALVLFFSIIIPQLWQSLEKLVNNLQGYLETVERTLTINLDDFHIFSSEANSRFLGMIEKGIMDSLEKLSEIITAYSPKLLSAVTGFATQLMNIGLGLIISIYMLADKKRFSKQAKKLVYAIFKKERAERIVSGVQRANTTFGGFISGKIIDSCIIGVICFIGMTILRIPYAPLVSVVILVANIIPFFGPILGAIPTTFIILLEDPLSALWFVIFVIVLQQADGNFIGPKIIGQKIGLSSFWIIFALLIMGSYMGVFGMLIAVPVFAIIYDGVRNLCNASLKKKGYNEDMTPIAAEEGSAEDASSGEKAENGTTDKENE